MAEPPKQPASSNHLLGLRGSAAAAPIAGDLLYGADAIAVFLFGDRKHRRRVYNLVDRGGLPVFRISVSICARKSVLLEWIATHERGHANVPRGTARD